MKTPKVSVIMPIYNVERYLRQCLDSVVNQTLKDIEIICVNDGSTDASLTILEEYAKNDERVKIISKPNSGYGHTMNVGMESAIGEYIGIVESDDYIELDMYEILYNKAKENDVDFVKSDYYRFTSKEDEAKFVYVQLTSEDKEYYNRIVNPEKNLVVFKFAMNTWSGIYKRSFIEKFNIRHNETPGASFQDNGFWIQTFYYAQKIYFLDQPFYRYRFDNVNSSIHDKDKVYTICEEWAFALKILNNNPELKEKFAQISHCRQFLSYMWNYRRIEDKFKKDFLKRFCSEFKTFNKNKELDEKLFSPKEWSQLMLIIKNPGVFYRKINNKLNLFDEIYLGLVFLTSKNSMKKIVSMIKLQFV